MRNRGLARYVLLSYKQRIAGSNPASPPKNALQTVKHQAEQAGLDPAQVTCHTFRATGITTFLENGGDLETAQHIAGHASVGTTRIYDHREQKVAQEEIEGVRIRRVALRLQAGVTD